MVESWILKRRRICRSVGWRSRGSKAESLRGFCCPGSQVAEDANLPAHPPPSPSMPPPSSHLAHPRLEPQLSNLISGMAIRSGLPGLGGGLIAQWSEGTLKKEGITWILPTDPITPANPCSRVEKGQAVLWKSKASEKAPPQKTSQTVGPNSWQSRRWNKFVCVFINGGKNWELRGDTCQPCNHQGTMLEATYLAPCLALSLLLTTIPFFNPLSF